MALSEKQVLGGQASPRFSANLPSRFSWSESSELQTTNRSLGGTRRGLKAFGGAAIRSASVLIRLVQIKKFLARNYLSDETSQQHPDIVEDLLELSGNCYPTHIRKPALRTVLHLVVEGQTAGLVRSVIQWPSEKIRMFINEIMACLPDGWVTTSRSDMHKELQTVYSSLVLDTFPGMRHGATYILEFIIAMSRQSEIAARAVLDAGFLCVIINCITYDRDIRRPDVTAGVVDKHWNTLLSTSVVALSSLASYSTCRTRIIGSPLYMLWPIRGWHDLKEMGLSSLKDLGPILPHLRSPTLLHSTELCAPVLRHPGEPLSGLLINENFDMIRTIFADHSLSAWWTIDYALGAELVRLAGISRHAEASRQAAGILIKCITMRTGMWDIFQEVLFISQIDTVERFFSHVITWCMGDGICQAGYGVAYSDTASTCPPIDPWERCLAFSIAAAKQKQAIIQALVRAGIVNLALFVPSDVFRMPSLNDVPDWQAVLYEIVHCYIAETGDKAGTAFSLEFLFTVDQSDELEKSCDTREADLLSLSSFGEDSHKRPSGQHNLSCAASQSDFLEPIAHFHGSYTLPPLVF